MENLDLKISELKEIYDFIVPTPTPIFQKFYVENGELNSKLYATELYKIDLQKYKSVKEYFIELIRKNKDKSIHIMVNMEDIVHTVNTELNKNGKYDSTVVRYTITDLDNDQNKKRIKNILNKIKGD